jgi:hypothetical protein
MTAFFTVLIFFILLADSTVFSKSSQNDLEHAIYPDQIVKYEVRKDFWSNEEVSRGRLHLAEMNPHTCTKLSSEKKIPYETFKKILQCAPQEPGLDGLDGSISLTRLVKPSRKTVEVICAWAESTRCSQDDWSTCQDEVVRFKKHGPDNKNDISMPRLNFFARFQLVRIIDSELYLDWPWGAERTKIKEVVRCKDMGFLGMYKKITNVVSGIEDLVFFSGGEHPFLPFNTPFPAFSSTADEKHANIPWPWNKEFHEEANRYHQALGRNDGFVDKVYSDNNINWEDEIAKAAYMGHFDNLRRMIMDQARLRPDLFEVKEPYYGWDEPIHSWDPAAQSGNIKPNATAGKDMSKDDIKSFVKGSDPGPQHEPQPGEASYILPLLNQGSYDPRTFKYTIVLLAMNGIATADRLAHLLAYSGSVVLMQDSSFIFHFSARLIPWVHYVPLTYSTTDAIDKIEWLKRNDEKARQIAENGRNFGKSFLRLEDLYCYAATALHTIGLVMKNSTAHEPFNPQKVSFVED